MSGSADTRAREPQLFREFAEIIARRWNADNLTLIDGLIERLTIEDGLNRAIERSRATNAALTEEVERLTLAAGVGVPPQADQALVAQSAENADVRGLELDCEWLEGEVANLAHALNLARDALKAVAQLGSEERDRITAQAALDRIAQFSDSSAGVGEARPAEPRAYIAKDEHGTPFLYFPDGGETGGVYRREATAAEVVFWAELGRLRKQLDAARHALDVVRAALGVVGPPPDEVGALGQTASETRGGES